MMYANQYEANAALSYQREISNRRIRRAASLLGCILILATIGAFWVITSVPRDYDNSTAKYWWERFFVFTNEEDLPDESGPKSFNPNQCQNSVQGRDFIVDDTGRVCNRSLLDSSSGCCPADGQRSYLFSCTTCVRNGTCCRVYEYCVSCCMRTENRALLDRVITTERVRATADDQLKLPQARFSVCAALCRTNSASVVNEHMYRGVYKHCYHAFGS